MLRFVIPHISVWGSSFVGCHPARIRPSFLPSFFPSFPPSSSLPPPLTRSLARSLSHSLTQSLTHSLTDSLTHSLTHTFRRLQRLRHSLTHSFTPLTPSLTRLQKGLQCPETAEGPAARVVAAGPALSAVSRDCRRACGARGRRWAGSLRSVQRLQKGLRRAWSPLGRLCPQCPETAEGPAARVVAAGPALSTVSGGCRTAGPALSAVSRDCRRACGARGRLSPQCPETAEGPAVSQSVQSPAARLVAVGPALSAVSRDCRRACGARGRRWAGSLCSGRLSPQCPETAEGPAARVVAAGPALSAVSRDCKRACSVQRLQKGLRRALGGSPVSRDCRRACGARGRRWAGSLRSVQRLQQKGLRRAWSPLGRLSPQCPETAEGPAARVVAAGPALSAVSRDCRRAGGARGRRWAPGGSVSRDCRRPQCPETTEGPAARVVAAGPALSAVSRDCKRLQRRAWSPLGRLSPQCPETAEGPVARVVAAGPHAGLCPETAEGRSVQRLQKGLRRARSPRGPRRFYVQRRQKAAVSRDYRRARGARGRHWGPLRFCALLPL